MLGTLTISHCLPPSPLLPPLEEAAWQLSLAISRNFIHNSVQSCLGCPCACARVHTHTHTHTPRAELLLWVGSAHDSSRPRLPLPANPELIHKMRLKTQSTPQTRICLSRRFHTRDAASIMHSAEPVIKALMADLPLMTSSEPLDCS